MGKYARYLSDKYPTEDHIERLLEKYEADIDKYMPGLDLGSKVAEAKNIAHITRASWVQQVTWKTRQAKKRRLINAFKADPTPKTLARYMAFRAKHSLGDLVTDLGNFTGDTTVALATFSDARDVEKDRRRREQKKLVNEQLESHQGLHTVGQGPMVYNRKGSLGEPIIIVKKGIDMAPAGLTEATRNGAPIMCFPIAGRGISVIKKRSSLRTWFADHTSHFLVRVEEGDISDFTGQNRRWAEIDKMLDSPWPPLKELNTVGVTVQRWQGLYIEEDQYEVIDPAMLVVRHFVGRAEGIFKTGAESIVKAPNDIAEALRSAQEFGEPVVEAAKGLLEMIQDEEASGDLSIVEVKFTPVGGIPLQCEVANSARFVVNDQPARGVLIGDIMESVLELAGPGA